MKAEGSTADSNNNIDKLLKTLHQLDEAQGQSLGLDEEKLRQLIVPSLDAALERIQI